MLKLPREFKLSNGDDEFVRAALDRMGYEWYNGDSLIVTNNKIKHLIVYGKSVEWASETRYKENALEEIDILNP